MNGDSSSPQESNGRPQQGQGGEQGEKEATPEEPEQEPGQRSGEEQPNDRQASGRPDSPKDSGERDPRNRQGQAPPDSETDRVRVADDIDRWGDLPVHVREIFRSEGGGDLPPQYRDWIESYYRRLNRAK